MRVFTVLIAYYMLITTVIFHYILYMHSIWCGGLTLEISLLKLFLFWFFFSFFFLVLFSALFILPHIAHAIPFLTLGCWPETKLALVLTSSLMLMPESHTQMFVIRKLIVSTRPEHERTENRQWTEYLKNRMTQMQSNCSIDLLTLSKPYLLVRYSRKSNLHILLDDPLAIFNYYYFFQRMLFFPATDISYYNQTYWPKCIAV